MDQTLINWAISAAGALMGVIMKVVWDGVTDLQKADKGLIDRIAGIEVLVAGSYVKRDDLATLSAAIFAKLDKIENKLDGKADK